MLGTITEIGASSDDISRISEVPNIGTIRLQAEAADLFLFVTSAGYR
jgi:hypothetical protein